MNASLQVGGAGGHSCAAVITMLNRDRIEGRFSSEDYHAEMDALSQVDQLGGIASIEIEKEPCTRCAVVLNALGLSRLVSFKKSGQKDYPTWRMPEGMNGVHLLGIDQEAEHEADRQALLNLFRTKKWW